MGSDEVIIKKARLDDAEGINAFMQAVTMEPGLGIVTDPGEYQITLKQEEAWIRGHLESENSFLAVAVNEAEEIVGLLGCTGGKRRATAHEATLGMTVKKEYRDKGVGTRLMQAALDWARSNVMVKRLQLEVFTSNTRAIHLYKKMGFDLEGIRRSAYRKEGKWTDAIVMSVLFLNDE